MNELNASLNPPENNSNSDNRTPKQSPQKQYLSINDLFPETNPDTPE